MRIACIRFLRLAFPTKLAMLAGLPKLSPHPFIPGCRQDHQAALHPRLHLPRHAPCADSSICSLGFVHPRLCQGKAAQLIAAGQCPTGLSPLMIL